MTAAAELIFISKLFPKHANVLQELVLLHGHEAGLDAFSKVISETPQRKPRASRCEFTDKALRLTKESLGRGLTKAEEKQIRDFFVINKDNDSEMLWEHWKVSAMRFRWSVQFPVHGFVAEMANVAQAQKRSKVTPKGCYPGTRSQFEEWQGE
mgnify:CR=1 FL=1